MRTQGGDCDLDEYQGTQPHLTTRGCSPTFRGSEAQTGEIHNLTDRSVKLRGGWHA